MILAAHLLAAATPDLAGSLSGYLAGSGILGLLILDACVTKKIITWQLLLKQEKEERERERAAMEDRIEKQAAIISDLTDHYVNDLVPALTLATDVNRQYVDKARVYIDKMLSQ